MGAYEVIPAFSMIVLGIMGMATANYGIHMLFYGKPKPSRVDPFDQIMFKRDAILKGQIKPDTHS